MSCDEIIAYTLDTKSIKPELSGLRSETRYASRTPIEAAKFMFLLIVERFKSEHRTDGPCEYAFSLIDANGRVFRFVGSRREREEPIRISRGDQEEMILRYKNSVKRS